MTNAIATTTTTAAATTVADLSPIVRMVTDSVNSPHTKRAYERALTEFVDWYASTRPGPLSKATVRAYVTHLQSEGVPVSSLNQRLTAIRKLALESADNGLIDEHTAQAIRRIEGVKVEGRKLGNWLTKAQAQEFIRTPDTSTVKGMRDRAILAVLLGCGLRRDELVSLTVDHIQQREGRWVVVDLVGKRNKRRSVPMPSWVKAAIDYWLVAGSIVEGVIFRPVDKGERVHDRAMTAQAVYNLVVEYADALGVDVKPHDLRRTFAKLARNAGAELDQIQLTLGHSSVETTQRYVGDNQNLTTAPGDMLGLDL